MLTSLHRELDRGAAHGLHLGCVYVDAGRLADRGALHPTWTHGSLGLPAQWGGNEVRISGPAAD
jgi:hypothetical protein